MKILNFFSSLNFSYDIRGKSTTPGGVVQWGDEEVWGPKGASRAWFDTTVTPAHLLVRSVKGRDEGGYRCKVHFKSSPSWSQRITLTVQGRFFRENLFTFFCRFKKERL